MKKILKRKIYLYKLIKSNKIIYRKKQICSIVEEKQKKYKYLKSIIKLKMRIKLKKIKIQIENHRIQITKIFWILKIKLQIKQLTILKKQIDIYQQKGQ
jgi:hypothetical protein